MESKNVNITLDTEQFDFDHKYIYYLWCSEVMGTPVFGKVKIIGKLSGTSNGKPFVEYRAERSMKVSCFNSIDYFEDKYYNKWLDISFNSDTDREINQIYYSLNKKDIEKEYTKAYNEWGKAIRDKISEANKMLNNLIGGYNKFFEDYNAED